MKTTTLKAMLLITISIFVLSCSKDDEPTAPVFQEENFLDTYLTTTGFNQDITIQVNAGNYEFGSEFTPIVNGKITTLSVKLPDVNTALKVTIWDKLAGTVLRTEIVNVASANTVFSFDITDLVLTKDKEYAITMNTNDWYERSRTDSSPITYPVTSGNIKINSYKWISGTAQTYPTNSETTYYGGDLSFSFLQIN